jgi:hypothetical protein
LLDAPRTTDMTAHTWPVTIEQITLADDPERWDSLGFSVSDATVALGAVRVALVGRDTGQGVLGWSLRDVASVELDGLPTTVSKAPILDTEVSGHDNGITTIDHVVAMSPDLDRSVVALQAAGIDLRRIREQPTPTGAPRQAFFRLGEVILELVQEPAQIVAARPEGASAPARFWGLALLSDDLERTVAQLGEHSSEIRDAVQPGRRIATLRRSAGLAVPVALMSRAENLE